MSGNVAAGGFLYGLSIRSGGGTTVYVMPKTSNLDTVGYNGLMYYEKGKLMVYATTNRYNATTTLIPAFTSSSDELGAL